MSKTSKVPENQRRFASRVVRELGTLVARLQCEGKDEGLSDEEIKRTLLLTFDILGKKAGISYASLVQKIRHNL